MVWQQWLNALLGLWVIVIPFTGMVGNAMTQTLVVTGVVIAGLALWGAVVNTAQTDEHRRLQHSS